MKKSFILLAVIAYACVAVYSLTRIKNPALRNANAQFSFDTSNQAKTFTLFTNNQGALMKFYREAFNTDWQASGNGYQGQVLDAKVQLLTSKKRSRRTTLSLNADDLDAIISDVINAGGDIKAKPDAAGKRFTVTDPDGNQIVLTQKTE